MEKTKKPVSKRNISSKRQSFGNRETNYNSTNKMLPQDRPSTEMQPRVSNKFNTKRSNSRGKLNKTPTI